MNNPGLKPKGFFLQVSINWNQLAMESYHIWEVRCFANIPHIIHISRQPKFFSSWYTNPFYVPNSCSSHSFWPICRQISCHEFPGKFKNVMLGIEVGMLDVDKIRWLPTPRIWVKWVPGIISRHLICLDGSRLTWTGAWVSASCHWRVRATHLRQIGRLQGSKLIQPLQWTPLLNLSSWLADRTSLQIIGIPLMFSKPLRFRPLRLSGAPLSGTLFQLREIRETFYKQERNSSFGWVENLIAYGRPELVWREVPCSTMKHIRRLTITPSVADHVSTSVSRRRKICCLPNSAYCLRDILFLGESLWTLIESVIKLILSPYF